MKKPEVSIENYPAVFEYYDQHGPSPTFARFGHFVMSKLYSPTIEVADSTQNIIQRYLSEGYLTLIVTNHDSKVDQYNLAGFVRRVPSLRPLITKTVIPAKGEVYTKPGPLGKLQRNAVDWLGSYPVIRSKDLPEDASDEERQQQKDASDLSVQLGLNKTERDGYHLGGFPEGERTKEDGDHTVVKPLRRGFSEIYMNALKSKRLMIVTAGMFYGTNDMERRYKAPHIYIGSPIVDQLNSVQEVTETMHYNLQRDLDIAVHNRMVEEKLV